MKSPIPLRSHLTAILFASTALSAALICTPAHAQHYGRNAPAPRAPEPDVRAGGVMDVSYNYHQHGLNAGVRPPSPWYGWGFPVQTYRWGWFGASRYYPWTFWHEGYYGDCCRYAYRCGY